MFRTGFATFSLTQKSGHLKSSVMWPLFNFCGATVRLLQSLELPLSSQPLSYNEQCEKLISLRQVALGIQAARTHNYRARETTH